MAKRDRELRHRLEELFSSEAEAPPPAAGPIEPAASTADAPSVEASPIEAVAKALDTVPPELWKTILDHLPLPVYLKDREHTWVAVNGACGDLLGRPAGMLLGRTDKEQPDEAWQLDDQVLETGQPDDTQATTTALDGSLHTRRTRRLPLSDKQGQVRYVLGIIEDSVKPAAEPAASAAPVDSAALARFQAIVEATPIPILITRVTDGRPLYVNTRASTMFGVPREDMLNHTTLEFYNEATDRQKILTILQRDGRVTNYELHLKRPDGSLLWVMLDVQPMVYNNERAVLSGFYDITARKQAEEQLRYSEALHQSLIETIPENLCRKDIQGHFTYGNRHYLELVGLRLEELIGKTDFDIHPPALAEKYRADDQAVLAGGKAVEFLEEHVVLGSTEKNYVRTIKSPLSDAQGHVIGIQIMFWDATELGRAEQALKLRTSALEAAANGIAITNQNGEITWVNPAFTQLTGYTFEEAVGQHTRILNSGRQSKAFYDAMWQTILSGQTWHGELINRRKDASEYDEEITITPVRAGGAEITHFVAIMRDIRERKRYEQQMLRFKLGLERSGDAIFITDLDGVIEYINPAFEQTYGYSAAEAIGQTPRILKSGVIPQERYAHFWQTLKARGTVAGELVNKTKDGRLITIEGANTPIINDADELVGFLAVHRDITARKETDRRLAEAAQRLQILVENVPDLIYIKNRQSQFLVANQSVAALTGAPSVEALLGKTDLDFFPREFAEKYLADEQAIMQEGRPRMNMEEASAGPDGKPRWLSTTKVPFRDASGEIAGIIGIGRDITERKQIEAERERLLTAEARRAVQMQTGSEIANAASTILDPDKLLPVVVELVRERYDLYYAGLFLIDGSGRWAELRAGTGEAGRKMLEAHHRLEVGGASMIGRCVATGEPRIALDVGAEAIRFSNPLLPRTRSEMALPLTSRGQIIGALTIQSTQLAAFTTDDISALRTMSSQIATAIENARLFQETQRRAEEQTVLFDLAQSLSAQLAVDQVLQQIYQGASRLIDTANFYIGLYDPARHEVDFVINASESVVDKSITTISADQGMTGYIIRTRSSVLIKEDIDSWLKAHGLQRVGSAAQSWLGIPLMLGDQVLGVMSVQNYTTPNVYDEHDRDVLQLLGAQAAIAIQNARLFEQARARTDQLAGLNRIGQSLAKLAERSEILELVNQVISQVINNRNLYIALYDAAKNQIEFPVYTIDGERRAIAGRPFGNGMTEYVIRTRTPLLIQSDVQDYSDRLGIAQVGLPAQCFLAVPILVGDNAIGVITLQDYEHAHVFSSEHVELLTTIASQAAVALENARLFEQTQATLAETTRYSEQLVVLNELGRMLRATLNVDTILNTAYTYTSRLMNTDSFFIALYDSDANMLSFPLSLSYNDNQPARVESRPLKSGLTDYIIRQRQPLLLSDNVQTRMTELGLEFLAFGNAEPALSWLGVPMIFGDQVLGAIVVQSITTPGLYTTIDRDLLTAIASQTAVAIENARLFEQTRDARAAAESRLRETQVLQEFSQAVSQALDVPQVLDALVTTLQNRLEFSHIAIALIELEAAQLTIVRGVGSAASLQGLRRPLEAVNNDITMDIMRRGQIEVIDGWDDRLDQVIFEREGHADLVRAFVPVRLREEAIGFFEVGYQRTARPQITPEETRVLSGLADQVSIAVDNARLLEQVQTALGEAEQLYNASQQLSTAPDVPGMLAALVQHVSVPDVNRVIVWLYEFDAERQVTAIVVGAAWHSGVGEPPPPIGTRLPPAAMHAFQFARSRQPIITNDAEHDDRLNPGSRAVLRQLHVRAVAILPLWASDRQVGMLMLQSEQPHTFVDTEIRPYTSLTQQMATAIENRRLFEQTQVALAQTERLVQHQQVLAAMSDKIYRATDVKSMLEIATEELRRATGSTRAVVKLSQTRLHAETATSEPAADGTGITS